MKKSILLIGLGLILLTGCSKDDSIEQINEQAIEQINEQTTDVVYVTRQLDGNTIWETMEIDIDDINPYSDTTDPRGYGFTTGLYKPLNTYPLLIKWTGTKDENGYSGSAEIRMTTPSYSFHFIMETECVTVIDNVAMYGGLITQVVEKTSNLPIDPLPFGINWRFYFKVIDNEVSRHSNVDKISSLRIFAPPRSKSLCNVYPPNHRVWDYKGYDDIHEPGFVVVNEEIVW